jgi:hypothetical protein
LKLKIKQNPYQDIHKFEGATLSDGTIMVTVSDKYLPAKNRSLDMFLSSLLVHESIHYKQQSKDKAKYLANRKPKTLNIKAIVLDEAEAYYYQAMFINGYYLYPSSYDKKIYPIEHKIFKLVERYYGLSKGYFKPDITWSRTNFTDKQKSSIKHSIKYYHKVEKDCVLWTDLIYKNVDKAVRDYHNSMQDWLMGVEEKLPTLRTNYKNFIKRVEKGL